GVELGRGARLLARVDLLAALAVLAAHDPVVVARADPLEDLRHAPDGELVRLQQLDAEAAELVPAGLPLLVLGRLRDERVEAEPARRGAAGEHHQRLAR